ncbi:MAG TPA: DUF1071 domain-containing protein [Aquirhabdus sp.]
MDNNFIKLASLNVNDHVEKKGQLSYLSWAWAVDQLMRLDPSASWVFHDPQTFGQSVMVSCTVTAFGKPMTMWLPVMDHRNKAIASPDAVDMNKNMMRCLTKCIAVHGLGLYIYAGEDLPEAQPEALPDARFNAALQLIKDDPSKKVAVVKQLSAFALTDKQQADLKSA